MGFCGFDNQIKETLKWTDKNFPWELQWLSILWFLAHIFYWVTSCCQLWWYKVCSLVYSFGSVYQIQWSRSSCSDHVIMQIIKWQQLASILVTCRSLVFFFFFLEKPWDRGGIYQLTQWHKSDKTCASIILVSPTKQNDMYLNGGYKTRVATGSPRRPPANLFISDCNVMSCQYPVWVPMQYEVSMCKKVIHVGQQATATPLGQIT